MAPFNSKTFWKLQQIAMLPDWAVIDITEPGAGTRIAGFELVENSMNFLVSLTALRYSPRPC